MDSFDALANDIHSALPMDRPNSTGWMACYCPSCGETRKKTGGFKIDPETIGYNCFKASCSATCVFEKGQPISRKFKDLMEIIGVRIPVDLRMVKSSVQLKIQRELEAELYTEHSYKAIKIPEYWTHIRSTDVQLISFFEKRCIDPSPLLVIRDGYRKGHGAYPMYFYTKLIGFQLINPENVGPRYQTFTDDNSSLLMINGGTIHQKPLVVEGAIDALSFPTGVGTLNHSVTKEQAYMLRGKDVHLFPDKNGGEKYLKAMRRYGWKMVIPSWKEVGDLNDCVVRYGMLSTARMITQNIYTDFLKAEVAYRLWSNQ